MTTAPRPYFHDIAPSGNWWTVTPTPPPPPWTRPPLYPPIPPRTLPNGPQVFVFAQTSLGKGLSLWTGSANSAPPSGWETAGFDDAAWGALYDVTTGTTGSSAAAEVWTTYPAPASATEQILVRQHVTIPAGTVLAAQVTFSANDTVRGIYLNGSLVAGTDQGLGFPPGDSLPVTPSLLASGDLLIAVSYQNQSFAGPQDAGGSFTLRVTLDVPGVTPLTYADSVLADSPLAYWPLDEASGTTIADASGNGHTGAIVGTGIVYGAAGPQVGSHALSFTGADFGTTPYISVPAAGALPPSVVGSWTLEAWIQFDPASGTATPGILGYGEPASSPTYRNYLNLNGPHEVLHTLDATALFVPTVFLLTHAWHHLVVTFDGTTRTVYLDGAVLSSDTPTVVGFAATDVLLGSTFPGGSGHSAWRGYLASVAIYDTALSAARVSAHYNAGGTAGPPVVAPNLVSLDPAHGPAVGGSAAPTLSALSPAGGPASGGNNRPPTLTSLEP